MQIAIIASTNLTRVQLGRRRAHIAMRRKGLIMLTAPALELPKLRYFRPRGIGVQVMRVWMAIVLGLLASVSMGDDITLAQERFFQGEYAAALKTIEPAARAGDPLAQAVLATAYDTGQGKDQSAILAVEWFTKSAEQDNAPAQLALAKILFEGRDGVSADPEAAQQWLTRAIQKGEPGAFLLSGDLMLSGDHGTQSAAGAAAMYIAALELGEPRAGMALAALYENGTGVAQSAQRARDTYAQTAQLGYSPAMARLAEMYELGQGGDADLTAAYALLQEAVNLGDVRSALNMALFMQSYEGYWSDPPLAYAYCLWGLKNLGDDATQADQAACTGVLQDLSDDQKREGEEIAAQF